VKNHLSGLSKQKRKGDLPVASSFSAAPAPTLPPPTPHNPPLVKRERAQTTSFTFSENHKASVLCVQNHDKERKASKRTFANARIARDGARFCLEGAVLRPCGTAECVFLSEEHGAAALWDQEHQEKGKEIKHSFSEACLKHDGARDFSVGVAHRPSSVPSFGDLFNRTGASSSPKKK
jgi:hypothetical protein